MPDLAQQIINDVLAACQAGAEAAAAAIARAFQSDVQVVLGQHSTLQSAAATLDLDGAGLIVALNTDRITAVLTIPAAQGLVPDWCVQPDSSGESRLATLAQELEMNLLPETWLAQDLRARWVPNMAEALGRGGVPQDAVVVPLAASLAGRADGTIGLIWPVQNTEGLFAVEPREPHPANATTRQDAASTELIGQPTRKVQPTLSLNSNDLPAYTRSLLRIKVPVVVTLAEKRQKLRRIVELGPGAIIQFDKSCEEMLDLEVGNGRVASGEAVKVGDKFGLRITAISLPDERFNAMKPA